MAYASTPLESLLISAHPELIASRPGSPNPSQRDVETKISDFCKIVAISVSLFGLITTKS